MPHSTLLKFFLAIHKSEIQKSLRHCFLTILPISKRFQHFIIPFVCSIIYTLSARLLLLAEDFGLQNYKLLKG